MITTRIVTTLAIALFSVLVISAMTGAAKAYASGGLMSLVAHGAHDIYISTGSILSQQDCPPEHRDCETPPAQGGSTGSILSQQDCPPEHRDCDIGPVKGGSTSNDPLGEEIPGLRSPPG
jgi:hypothetical protein